MKHVRNLVYREEEREKIPLCLDQGVGVIPWSPLARGLLGHLDDAIAAVDVTLGEDEVGRLEAPYRPHPLLGHS